MSLKYKVVEDLVINGTEYPKGKVLEFEDDHVLSDEMKAQLDNGQLEQIGGKKAQKKSTKSDSEQEEAASAKDESQPGNESKDDKVNE